MKKQIILSIGFVLSGFILFAQDSGEKTILQIVDELRYQWDDEADALRTYDGLVKYCRTKPYRDKITKLLDDIHHYDSALYDIVKAKFAETQDAEAEATIADIEKLELDYKTRSFRSFLLKECTIRNDIDRNSGAGGVDRDSKEVKALEEELSSYVESVTIQVDVVDEHVHHMDGMDIPPPAKY